MKALSADVVAEAATDAGASSTLADEVALCVDEAVANVARHAYDHSFGSVTVLVQTDRGVLTVIVRDQGRGLVDGPGSESDGFGLRIIETLASELAISSVPKRGTELRMQFPLDAPQRRRVA